MLNALNNAPKTVLPNAPATSTELIDMSVQYNAIDRQRAGMATSIRSDMYRVRQDAKPIDYSATPDEHAAKIQSVQLEQQQPHQAPPALERAISPQSQDPSPKTLYATNPDPLSDGETIPDKSSKVEVNLDQPIEVEDPEVAAHLSQLGFWNVGINIDGDGDLIPPPKPEVSSALRNDKETSSTTSDGQESRRPRPRLESGVDLYKKRYPEPEPVVTPTAYSSTSTLVQDDPLGSSTTLVSDKSSSYCKQAKAIRNAKVDIYGKFESTRVALQKRKQQYMPSAPRERRIRFEDEVPLPGLPPPAIVRKSAIKAVSRIDHLFDQAFEVWQRRHPDLEAQQQMKKRSEDIDEQGPRHLDNLLWWSVLRPESRLLIPVATPEQIREGDKFYQSPRPKKSRQPGRAV